MTQFPRRIWLILCLALAWSVSRAEESPGAKPHSDANRLTYLDENDPFYPGLGFPKLTTPQWVGEAGVEAVVILAIDDMHEPEKYEKVLRPILDRLKQIDGRAPVSIFCNKLDPAHPQLAKWLQEGLSFEAHTMTHPCPLLATNLQAAAANYDNCVQMLNRIPGAHPVAFRMPCCDSMDSPSPRFYAELFNRTNQAGQFLTIDSSIMNLLTGQDPSLRREWVQDANGQEKFRKYLPFPAFVTTVENYPYPFVIGRLCWEFPPMVPSDWEAQHVHGTNNPVTVADWEAALDATVAKQGTFTFIFHPHGWIRPEQLVEFIDYAAQRYGPKVKFLNFREAEERLNRNLLAGQPLRGPAGQENGVRLLDLNGDGYLDVVIGNAQVRKTRIWAPETKEWVEQPFPTQLVSADGSDADAGARFGILTPDGHPSVLVRSGASGAWTFDGHTWQEARGLLAGLDAAGQPILTADHGRDRGVRLRDVDNDGRCELIVGNEQQNAVLGWSPEEETWKPLAYSLPPGTAIVDALGRDNGLRFVDVNQDGYADVLFSNESRYALHLFIPKRYLGFERGWSRVVLSGSRGEEGEIPPIVRTGPARNNGVWFHARQLWVQNEDTAALPDHVDRRTFDELMGGYQPKAKSPAASLACMRTLPGFKVELVASEPLVRDPIAFEWGSDGKLWVVEMGDYPLGLDGHGQPGGTIKFLEDTDGDGRYDKATVFLDHVNFPTGVMPWGKGVLVSAAPEIFYAEDRDGDGKADLRVTLFKGFREGNQQHRVNGFEYGLDNWVYGANGDSSGEVEWAGTPPGASANEATPGHRWDLRGHDFRFRPDTGAFETVSGETQYGRHRDDWGNWFGNNNPTWLWHVFLPEHYLQRNPNIPVRTVKEILANYPDATRVFPIGRSLQRFNDVDMLNHVTSANSATPYRDDLFGPEFATSVFISEPVHNAVHREVLEPEGVTFQSHRASGEKEREFLASSDNWFRPTMLKTGPDGALYVADMYRLVIEHPEWIPADAQRQFDLRAGADQGRIYRVYPANAPLRPIPKLDRATGTELAKAMESPNGSTRDTAQRLLVHAQDTSAVPELSRLVRESPHPKVRAQALWTLEGLHRLSPVLLLAALQDPHPAVREQAVRLTEPFLRASKPEGKLTPMDQKALEAAQQRLLELVNDSAVRVRFQLAFTLGEWADARAGRALVALASKDAGDSRMQTAVLSSAGPHLQTMVDSLLRESRESGPVSLLQELLSQAVARNQEDAEVEALQAITERPGLEYDAWQWAAAAGLLDGIERSHGSLHDFRTSASPRLQRALAGLDNLFQQARQLSTDSQATEAERLAATRLLGRGTSQQKEDVELLSRWLRPQVSPRLQDAALESLGKLRQAGVAPLLLAGWAGYEPNLRERVLQMLVNRKSWTTALLEAIRRGEVKAAQVSPPFRQKMLMSDDPGIQSRAREFFDVAHDRRKLLRDYAAVLEQQGDPIKGAALFQQNCSVCHRLHDQGTAVGPDLGALASKGAETLLIAILDPNQAVEARYLSYTAVTKSDEEVSGVMVAETPGSVTLRAAGGVEQTVLRSDLKDLRSSGMSLMPEGFEKVLTRQDLADLLAFIRRP